ncbi:MAG: hypothetical protein AAGI24_01695 [Pseudomonadota bacterium]
MRHSALIALSLASVAVGAEEELTESAVNGKPAAEELSNKSWLERGYATIDNRSDALATWVDGFFGHARDVQDEPKSLVRLRPQLEWDEQDGTDVKLKVTGKVHLPQANNRVSLLFSGEDGDFDQDFYDPGIAANGDSAAGVQYQVRRKKRSSAFLFAGVKSGPNFKVGARYRRENPLWKEARYRFSEEVFFVPGDGFTSLTRFDIDHALSDNNLLRWANRLEWGEETRGGEWRTRLEFMRRFDTETAFRSFVFIQGDTDPELLRTRGVGLGLRRRLGPDWLFWEVEPRYAWRRRSKDEEREGVASIRLRLEMIIGDL